MRYLIIPLFVALILSVLYEGIFYISRKQLERESGILKNYRRAEDVKISLFEDDKLSWVILGSGADFSIPSEVSIKKFFAKSGNGNLSISAEEAIILKKEQRVLLKGNVRVKIVKENKVVEIETQKATVDLVKNLIYGKEKVVIREPGKTVEGIGFKYNLRTGKFIIIRDVQTYLNSP